MIKLDNKTVLLALVLWFGYKYKDKINIPTNIFNKPAVVSENRVVSEPSAELKTLVTPIITALNINAPGRDKVADCYKVGDFYGDFAEIIAKDGVIKTNKAFREAHIAAGKQVFNKGEISGSYPNLEQLLMGPNGVVSSQLGLESGKTDVTKMYNTLKAIQWAAYQAAK
jgi:hypothetical protein